MQRYCKVEYTLSRSHIHSCTRTHTILRTESWCVWAQAIPQRNSAMRGSIQNVLHEHSLTRSLMCTILRTELRRVWARARRPRSSAIKVCPQRKNEFLTHFRPLIVLVRHGNLNYTWQKRPRYMKTDWEKRPRYMKTDWEKRLRTET